MVWCGTARVQNGSDHRSGLAQTRHLSGFGPAEWAVRAGQIRVHEPERFIPKPVRRGIVRKGRKGGRTEKTTAAAAEKGGKLWLKYGDWNGGRWLEDAGSSRRTGTELPVRSPGPLQDGPNRLRSSKTLAFCGGVLRPHRSV